MRYAWIALAITFAVLLAGCADRGSTQSLAPVCEALGEPLRYNAVNPKSDYHAGPKLAPQLAVRNRVGINLNCPGY